MSLPVPEKHHFHAFVTVSGHKGANSQPELTSPALIKIIFSKTQATNAVNCRLVLFSFPVSLSAHDTAWYN